MATQLPPNAFQRSLFVCLSLLLALILLSQGSIAAPPTPAGGDKIEAAVLAALTASDQTTFWLLLPAPQKLAQAAAIRDWNERGWAVYQQLRANADASQAEIVALLQARGVAYQPFWLVNAIQVTGDRALLNELAARPEVQRVVAGRVYEIPRPAPSAPRARSENIEWNIAHIRAPQVWSTFGSRGEEIVVANIDGGVEFTHPALAAQYRGNLGNGLYDHNYNWYDPFPYCDKPTPAPCDDDGHGTHTMGTLVGSEGDAGPNQIGVAPRARWIAAKGCDYYSCPEEALLLASQWILAPTDLKGQNPRPDLRPHIVSNSWGRSRSDPYLRAIVQAWEASGIFPVFAVGNSGEYGCQMVGSPGDYPESYTVGAFDRDNRIASFSSRGPSEIDQSIKPNISAPGVDVRSSFLDGGYVAYEGTSMAAPHVAGVVALMWSAAPALLGNIAETRALLDQSAIDVEDLRCGGTPTRNNVWGEGRLDAFAAVERSPRGPTGLLHGNVTPPGATIQITGPSSRILVTDNQGNFSVRLSVGSYALRVALFGYLDQNVQDVVVSEGATTTRDFQLAQAPTFGLSGHVLDSNGQPVADGSVQILNTPLPPVQTDKTGFYTFPNLPAGSYQVRAQAAGCNGIQTQDLILSREQVLDFALPEKLDVAGYRCRSIQPAYREANTLLTEWGDEGSVAVALPFHFVFYGKFYNRAYICFNGSLVFVDSCYSRNQSLPIHYPSSPAIYAFWDDLVVYGGGSIRTELLGVQPNRRFVIEWRNVGFYDATDETMRVDFEIILFENGLIQTHYRNIGPNGREQGDSATLGIEDGLGEIALQYSFDKPAIASPNFALGYMPPPGTILSGRVSSSSSGNGVANATVRAFASGSERHETTTDAAGIYHLRLPAGLYRVEASAFDYISRTAQLQLSGSDGFFTQDFALDSAQMDVSPRSTQITLTQGYQHTELLTLRNTGTSDLIWYTRESGGSSGARSTARSLWPDLQHSLTGDRPEVSPEALERLTAERQSSAPGPFDLIVADLIGDAKSADIVSVWGTSDGSDTLWLSVELTKTRAIDSSIGYVLLDTDQNPDTGYPVADWMGAPDRTVGIDYVVEFSRSPLVFVYSAATGKTVDATVIKIDDQRYSFDISLAALGNDDGALDLVFLSKDGYNTVDRAPDAGSGALYPRMDIPWFATQPANGVLPPGGSQAVELHFDGRKPDLAPSTTHSMTLLVIGNDPVNRSSRIPIGVQVAPAVAGPEVTIAPTATTHYSGSVSVPVHFSGSQYAITALDFALLLPESCLDFSTEDANGDALFDAVDFAISAGYSRTVSLVNDGAGKQLRVHLADISAPFTPLADGALLTVRFTAACQPPKKGQILVPLALAGPPALAFQDGSGKNIAGKAVGGSVRILWGSPGDSNGDGTVDVADIGFTVDELFDGDGAYWLDVPGGGVIASPVGVDANQDTLVDAADVICTALIGDGGPAACPASPTSQRDIRNAAVISISQKIPVALDQQIDVPIYLESSGLSVVATAFTLNFDPSWLFFDPTDGNSDGIPDSITFALAGSSALSATQQAGGGGFSLFVGDVTPPLTALPDGLLATITFQARARPTVVQTQGTEVQSPSQTAVAPDGVQLTTAFSDARKRETLLHFAQSPGVSAASSSGQSLPVTPQDGSVLIRMYELFVPQIER
ncbi:MAG: S8 family serine peptidase [Caldilineaceae bacterium]|nr:S8 family serine peptidase [Caldilineaceae bacterium]